MSVRTERPQPGEYAEFYGGYVARVPTGDIVALLESQLVELGLVLGDLPAEMHSHAYAPGKWTVREVVGHMTDAERVFAYRALRFARGDETPVPGFDENAYVPAGRFEERPLASLLVELGAVRRATIALLQDLPEAAWTRRGVANGQPITVRALANVAYGHVAHHLALLDERYGVRTPVPELEA
ncbi:MAG: DinB family protein [Longimicrobiales bacterium]